MYYFRELNPVRRANGTGSVVKLSGNRRPWAVRILGHADQSVTEHYTHLDAAFLRAELEKMP